MTNIRTIARVVPHLIDLIPKEREGLIRKLHELASSRSFGAPEGDAGTWEKLEQLLHANLADTKGDWVNALRACMSGELSVASLPRDSWNREAVRERLHRWRIHPVTVGALGILSSHQTGDYEACQIHMVCPRDLVLHGLHVPRSLNSPDVGLSLQINRRCAFDHLRAWTFEYQEPVMAIEVSAGTDVLLQVENGHTLPVEFPGGEFLVTFLGGEK